MRRDHRVRHGVDVRDHERVAPRDGDRVGLGADVGQRERLRAGEREPAHAEREPGDAEQRELDEPLSHDLIPFLTAVLARIVDTNRLHANPGKQKGRPEAALLVVLMPVVLTA